jgi:hypothetical protein
MTALIIIYGTLIAFFAKVWYNARQEEKRLEAIYGNVYSAKKPTKKEIRERNEVTRLLMSDEMEEQLQSINLDEHEKALA